VDASMTRSFAINPATIKVPLSDKRAGEVTVTVTNQSGAFKKGFVRCQPQGAATPDQKRPDILIDGEKERPFEKGAAQQFKVKVTAKPEVKEGTYQFRLDVANSADPEGDWTEGPVIEITVPKVGAIVKPSGPPWWIFLVIGAAVLLIGGVVLFFVLRPGGVEVPNLVGMTFEEAEKAAEAAGLKAEPADEVPKEDKKDVGKDDKKDDKKDPKTEAKDDKKDAKTADKKEPPKDEKKEEKPRDPKILNAKVESQDPAAGAKVSKDSVISLVLAKGAEHENPSAPDLAIPPVTSMTIEQAKLHLFEAGFTPVVGAPEFKGSTPGTIVEQKPTAGTKAPKGSDVTILPEKENVAVPPLVQKPLKDAIFDLNRLKLIGNIVYQTSPGPITDHVIDQNPKAGARVELNSTVTLTVHRGMIFPIIPREQLHLLQPATAKLFAVMNSITAITVSPGSPAYLRRTGLSVSFHYVTASGGQAKLRVTALAGGKQVPGSSEPVLASDAQGNGDLKAMITFKNPGGIDTIRVTLLGPDGKVLDEEHLAVKFTVTPF
jgi:beta-lactam-binding protein with PASTA domain